MKKTVIGVRYVLGLAFVVFGLNGFLHFMPMPPMPAEAGAFLGGLAGSGYFFPFLKSVEILCGLGLVLGLFVPLSLVILTPIMVNIILFHAFLAPSGLGLPIILLAMHLFFGMENKRFVCCSTENEINTADKTFPICIRLPLVGTVQTLSRDFPQQPHLIYLP